MEIGKKVWNVLSKDKDWARKYNPAQREVMRAFIEEKLDEIAGDLIGQLATAKTVASFKIRYAEALYAENIFAKLVAAMTAKEKAVHAPYDDDDLLVRVMKEGIAWRVKISSHAVKDGQRLFDNSGIGEAEYLEHCMRLSRTSVEGILTGAFIISELLIVDPVGMINLD